jgi:hypothetical protein
MLDFTLFSSKLIYKELYFKAFNEKYFIFIPPFDLFDSKAKFRGLFQASSNTFFSSKKDHLRTETTAFY